MQIFHVVGARPNFMKVAPVMIALAQYDAVTQRLVHTGQHYDASMSDVFFQQLGLPRPDINLEVGSGSHAVQTAEIMVRFEQVVTHTRPDLTLVYGDVNSTVAAALVSAKLGIRIGHVEAGLRSCDRTMPEEINRLVTDQLADLLFTPSADGNENLARAGIAANKVHLVGNVMIDTLLRLLPIAESGDVIERLGVQPESYGFITLHRPSNVDDPVMLPQILAALDEIAETLPLVFPIHPRTRQRLQEFGLQPASPRLHLVTPLGYLEFLTLQRHARLVITDSGGVQEETTYLGVPCLTVRENTERPVTITLGTNRLVGQDMQRLRAAAHDVLTGNVQTGQIPPLWDGHAGERIAQVISASC